MGACEDPELILIATGSEGSLAVDAAKSLSGCRTRVVSMPSCELFRAQSKAYREAVLPRSVPKLSIEAATTYSWLEFADGCVGLNCFGASAPGSVCGQHFGFTVENVVGCARKLLDGERGTLSDGTQ